MSIFHALARLTQKAPAISRPCSECHGTGRVPFTCGCCGKPLKHEDALCQVCLDNHEERCYERPWAQEYYFSAKQLTAYAAWKAKRA